MNSFKQFDIKPTQTKAFEGDKIKISKVLGREIVVHQFKIGDSKCFADRGTGKCLHLQITFNDDKRVIFTSSTGLIDQITQVPETGFPFKATIIQDNERFMFS